VPGPVRLRDGATGRLDGTPHGAAVERFALEELPGETRERVPVLGEQTLGALVLRAHDALDFAVNGVVRPGTELARVNRAAEILKVRPGTRASD
jgi:hypothetical protein